MMKKTCIVMAVLALGLLPLASAEIVFPCRDLPNQWCPNTLDDKCGGQINVSGATLFLEFFTVEAATTDYLDPDCDNTERIIDQLAPDFAGFSFGSSPEDWWLFQYRGVGSGNGLAELAKSACYGTIPTTPPVDEGYINRWHYYVGGTGTINNPWGCDYPGACCTGGVCTWVYQAECTGNFYGPGTYCEDVLGLNPCDATPVGACRHSGGCLITTQADCVATYAGTYVGNGESCGGNPCDAGTPVPPNQIDLAIMDVPTSWFVKIPGGDPAPNLNPGDPGYGLCPFGSWDVTQSNQLKSLECLNINVANPDEFTVYDTQIAWVAITIIANRGTGLGLGYQTGSPNLTTEGQITSSQLRHLYLTGRLPNGENLVAVTRDSGSGTRNGAMSCLDIDPSWGRGDNIGLKADSSSQDLLGPNFVSNHKGGSSRMEGVVQNHRLAVGYTGLFGSSRSAADAAEGRYEIAYVKFENNPNGVFTRPSLDNVLDNSNATPDAWQMGGPETFASVGDPLAGETGHETNPPMNNEAARDFLNNITASIAAFPAGGATPGQYLASVFQLTAAVDGIPNPADPGHFIANPGINPTLQEFIRANTTLYVPPFGITPANKYPTRTANPNWPDIQPSCDANWPADGIYSDGSSSNYINPHTGNAVNTSFPMNARNKVAGDFNDDGVRNLADVEKMVLAYWDNYVNSPAPAFPSGRYPVYRTQANSTSSNPAIPEIIGDFNGDGNFDKRDVRYFCDGLAIDPATGNLSRAAAFLAVDNAWFALTGDNNFFGTTLKDCTGATLPYIPGASAADVAGNTPYPGAYPHGYDCSVDCVDAQYIADNFGDWTVCTQAIYMDLSCDLNGDLVIDYADLTILAGWMGCNCVVMPCAGDSNCDGIVNWRDIDFFVAAQNDNVAAWEALFAPGTPTCPFTNNDVDGDGIVNWRDIDPFVGVQNTVCP